MVENSIAAVNSLIATSNIPKSAINGIGVAIPNELWNWTSEFGAPTDEMKKWKTLSLEKELSLVFHVPVLQENDGTAVAAAELAFGQNCSFDTFACIFVGTFIGGGIVIDRNLFRGTRGRAAGLGPMPVADFEGNQKRLLDMSSLFVFENRLRKAYGDNNFKLTQDFQWESEPEHLQIWIQEASRGIAHSIVSLLSMIDFEAIIVDGSFSPTVRNRLIHSINDEISKFDIQGIVMPGIAQGTFGSIARALGAASLPLLQNYTFQKKVFRTSSF